MRHQSSSILLGFLYKVVHKTALSESSITLARLNLTFLPLGLTPWNLAHSFMMFLARQEDESSPNKQCSIFSDRHWGEPSQSTKGPICVSYTVFHGQWVDRQREYTYVHLRMYSLWRSTYWVVKHCVRDTNGPFVDCDVPGYKTWPQMF